MIPNWSEGGEKALGMTGRLEASHRSLPLSRWLVRVFGTVVEPFVLAVLHA